jgi:peptide-methionine (S)-S-oxide reductase
MNRRWFTLTTAAGALLLMTTASLSPAVDPDAPLAKATFAGGCFWCTEAVFLELKGVYSVTSGYIGGTVPNPTYKDVCTGLTGHAEAIQIEYDPTIVSFQQLLEVFFATHDPTTLNRQGADVGTQYRSGIFVHDPEQQRIAVEIIRALDQRRVFPGRIVTEVTPASTFYPAEDYHQNYFANNPFQPYCQAVAAPKVAKVRKAFKELLKDGSAKPR